MDERRDAGSPCSRVIALNLHQDKFSSIVNSPAEQLPCAIDMKKIKTKTLIPLLPCAAIAVSGCG
jgi:hypothetical protein